MEEVAIDLIGEDVLITGAGPIGIMGALVAQKAGARKVVITDINQVRLKLAEAMGVDAASAKIAPFAAPKPPSSKAASASPPPLAGPAASPPAPSSTPPSRATTWA